MHQRSLATFACLLALASPISALAREPLGSVGSCADTVVQARTFASTAAAATGKAVEEVVLILANGLRVEGPEPLADTTFFWNFTPGHKVQVCLDALRAAPHHKERLFRITDLVTGASLHTRETHSL